MRSIGNILKEPVFGQLERSQELRAIRRKRRSHSLKLSNLATPDGDYLKTIRFLTDYEAARSRLREQNRDRYLGRGCFAYEREPWMDKSKSAHSQLLHHAERATLGVMRYKSDVSRKLRAEDNFGDISFKAQGAICYFCGLLTRRADWTIDHLTPLSRGGNNQNTNKIGCCTYCNNAKSCLTEVEYRDTDFYKETLLGKPSHKSEQRLKQIVRDIIKAINTP